MTPLRSESLTIDSHVSAAGVRTLLLSGPLTLQTLFEFQSAGREHDDKPLVLDLTQVPYMDSAGLGSLLGLYASCQRKGRGFALAGITERIRTLFTIAHVDEMLPAFATRDEAEAAAAKPVA